MRLLVEQRPQHHVAREQRHQHQPRQHAGDEQPRHRDLRRDTVDDHDDRRRNQQPERARAGQRTDRDGFRVAARLQLGQRDAADGGRCGRRRAADRREDAAADHVGVQQPARQSFDPGSEAGEHVVGQARAEQDLAHPDEQRQRRHRPARARCPTGGGEDGAPGCIGEDLHADDADGDQGRRHPHAQREQHEQGADERGGNPAEFHHSLFSVPSPSSKRWRRQTQTKRSAKATVNSTEPSTIGSCGNHKGTGTRPCETSLKR